MSDSVSGDLMRYVHVVRGVGAGGRWRRARGPGAAAAIPLRRGAGAPGRVGARQESASGQGSDRAGLHVLEDGKPQAVAAFSAIDLADPAPPPTRWMRDVASDVRRNTDIVDKRLVTIVMDDAAIPFEHRDGQQRAGNRPAGRRSSQAQRSRVRCVYSRQPQRPGVHGRSGTPAESGGGVRGRQPRDWRSVQGDRAGRRC